MSSLTDNLLLLKTGKQNLIDTINSKVTDEDKQDLAIDCAWEELSTLLAKIPVKKDKSSEIDANEIYTQICSDTRNEAITTNVTSIGDYSLYQQSYLPKLIAAKCTSLGAHALDGCTSLTEFDLSACTSLSSYALSNTSKLESIDLPLITSIPSYCFYNSGVISANLPKVTTISAYAFKNATRLESVQTADNVSIQEYAFQNCTSLSDNSIVAAASSIGQSSFINTGITAVESDRAVSIKQYAFQNCKQLETVKLNKCTSLTDDRVFYLDSMLQSILLPEAKTVGCWQSAPCIKSCAQLNTLYLPKVTKASYLIDDCPKLTSLSIPELTDVTGYGSLLSNCTNLETLDLPKLVYVRNTTNASGYYFLKKCPNLKTLNIPSFCGAYNSTSWSGSSTNSYYNYWFYQLGVTELNLSGVKANYPYSSSVLISDCRNLTSLNLDNLVCVIPYRSYNYTASIVRGCPNLTELTLPALTTVDGQYFVGSYGLAEASTCKARIDQWLQYYQDLYPSTYQTMPSYIMWYERRYGGTIDGTLENAAPYNVGKYSALDDNMGWCGLKKIVLPKLSRIGHNSSSSYPAYMFYHCHELEEIWLGDGTFTPSQTSLPYLFASGCYNLRRVVLNYPTVMTIGVSLENIFYDCPHLTGRRYYIQGNINNETKYYYYANELGAKDLYFYVPDDLVESYKSASNWSTYTDQIKPISDLYGLVLDYTVSEITAEQYKGDQTLSTILGYGVKSVSAYGFYNTSATRILFSNCTNVGDYAFAKSVNLAELTLAWTSLNNIGKYAFNETKLTTVTAAALTALADGVFKDCTELTTCTLSAVKSIGKEALKNTALSAITYATLLNIDKQAFKNCTNLASATLAIVATIADEAFMNDALTTISFPLLTTLGSSAFENNQLTTVTLPKIIVIGDRAFANNTEITTINLYGAMSIGNDVFDGCTALTDITFESYSMPACGNLPETCTLHIRASLVNEFTEKFPNNTIVGDVS